MIPDSWQTLPDTITPLFYGSLEQAGLVFGTALGGEANSYLSQVAIFSYHYVSKALQGLRCPLCAQGPSSGLVGRDPRHKGLSPADGRAVQALS